MALFSELVTKVTADTSGFESAMKRVTSAMNTFIGAAAIYKITSEVSELVTSMGELYTRTQSLGIGVAQFQALSLAAHHAGISSDELANSIRKMQETIGGASLGDKGKKHALGLLGLDADSLSGLDVQGQYLKIADAIKQIGDRSQQAAIAKAIFGKAGSKELGLFNSDIEATIQKSKELGLTLSDDQFAAVHKLGDSVSELGVMWDSVWQHVAANLAGPAQEFVDWLEKSIKEWGGMEVVATRVTDVIITGVNGMIAVFETLHKTIDLGVKSFINLQGYMASNELTDLYDKNSQSSQNLSPDARKSRISELEGILKEKYTAANTDLNAAGNGFQKVLPSSIASVPTEGKGVPQKLMDMSSVLDLAKTAVKSFAEELQNAEKLQAMLNGTFKDTSKPELKESSDFKEIARNLIEDKLAGTLTEDSAKSGLDLLDLTKTLDSNNFDQFHDLIDYDTSKIDKDMDDLRKLLLDGKGSSTIDVNVTASPEFDAKIIKISENSFTSIIAREATGTNK